VLSAVEVEERIQAVMDELENRTEEYDKCAHLAAVAEADYREMHARTLLGVVAGADKKMTVDEREAHVDAHCAERYKGFLIAQAARNSCRESLLSLRANLDSLRTLSASVRAQS
jgi:hypothetical protein